MQRPPMTRSAAALLVSLTGLALLGQGVWIHAKAMIAQILLERAFVESVATGRTVKPWAWADTWPVARIAVDRLNTSAIVLAGSSGQALAFGPGHVELTPDAGERGVAVYAAHRDTHFRFVKDLVIGDEIAVTRRDGATFRYRIEDTTIARFDQSGIDPQADQRKLVLSTCWPLDSATPGPLRYLVHATLIEETAAQIAGSKPI